VTRMYVKRGIPAGKFAQAHHINRLHQFCTVR
jgi:hypothetical protein